MQRQEGRVHAGERSGATVPDGHWTSGMPLDWSWRRRLAHGAWAGDRATGSHDTHNGKITRILISFHGLRTSRSN